MGLRDVFKFRDLPESEVSKPFLEHLEDLRWTIVKMAMTLLGAMVLCFVFRNALVHVMQRRLREETGFELAEGGDLIPLGDYFTSPGFTDERGYCFLARPVRESVAGHSRDESESILDCRAFGPEELRDLIANNEIRDANTLAICVRLLSRGLLSFGQV